ncbi:MAG: response regulator [Anaerolineae bacterium]|nr:response regulator [Anaerolineae bacterium]
MAHILIVDDYAVTQRVLRVQLQMLGHTAVAVGSAVEAIKRLQQETFDIGIFDLAMPDMNGLELMRHVRAQAHTRTLPVIMLTASAADGDRVRAQLAGVNQFLTKPVESQELKTAIGKCLEIVA